MPSIIANSLSNWPVLFHAMFYFISFFVKLVLYDVCLLPSAGVHPLVATISTSSVDVQTGMY